MSTRRSSILKPPKVRPPLQDVSQLLPNNDEEETTEVIRRRKVSFASMKVLKEFNSGADPAEVFHNPAYEEQFSASFDSVQSLVSPSDSENSIAFIDSSPGDVTTTPDTDISIECDAVPCEIGTSTPWPGKNKQRGGDFILPEDGSPDLSCNVSSHLMDLTTPVSRRSIANETNYDEMDYEASNVDMSLTEQYQRENIPLNLSTKSPTCANDYSDASMDSSMEMTEVLAKSIVIVRNQLDATEINESVTSFPDTCVQSEHTSYSVKNKDNDHHASSADHAYASRSSIKSNQNQESSGAIDRTVECGYFPSQGYSFNASKSVLCEEMVVSYTEKQVLSTTEYQDVAEASLCTNVSNCGGNDWDLTGDDIEARKLKRNSRKSIAFPLFDVDGANDSDSKSNAEVPLGADNFSDFGIDNKATSDESNLSSACSSGRKCIVLESNPHSTPDSTKTNIPPATTLDATQVDSQLLFQSTSSSDMQFTEVVESGRSVSRQSTTSSKVERKESDGNRSTISPITNFADSRQSTCSSNTELATVVEIKGSDSQPSSYNVEFTKVVEPNESNTHAHSTLSSIMEHTKAIDRRESGSLQPTSSNMDLTKVVEQNESGSMRATTSSNMDLTKAVEQNESGSLRSITLSNMELTKVVERNESGSLRSTTSSNMELPKVVERNESDSLRSTTSSNMELTKAVEQNESGSMRATTSSNMELTKVVERNEFGSLRSTTSSNMELTKVVERNESDSPRSTTSFNMEFTKVVERNASDRRESFISSSMEFTKVVEPNELISRQIFQEGNVDLEPVITSTQLSSQQMAHECSISAIHPSSQNTFHLNNVQYVPFAGGVDNDLFQRANFDNSDMDASMEFTTPIQGNRYDQTPYSDMLLTDVVKGVEPRYETPDSCASQFSECDNQISQVSNFHRNSKNVAADELDLFMESPDDGILRESLQNMSGVSSYAYSEPKMDITMEEQFEELNLDSPSSPIKSDNEKNETESSQDEKENEREVTGSIATGAILGSHSGTCNVGLSDNNRLSSDQKAKGRKSSLSSLQAFRNVSPLNEITVAKENINPKSDSKNEESMRENVRMRKGKKSLCLSLKKHKDKMCNMEEKMPMTTCLENLVDEEKSKKIGVKRRSTELDLMECEEKIRRLSTIDCPDSLSSVAETNFGGSEIRVTLESDGCDKRTKVRENLEGVPNGKSTPRVSNLSRESYWTIGSSDETIEETSSVANASTQLQLSRSYSPSALLLDLSSSMPNKTKNTNMSQSHAQDETERSVTVSQSSLNVQLLSRKYSKYCDMSDINSRWNESIAYLAAKERTTLLSKKKETQWKIKGWYHDCWVFTFFYGAAELNIRMKMASKASERVTEIFFKKLKNDDPAASVVASYFISSWGEEKMKPLCATVEDVPILLEILSSDSIHYRLLLEKINSAQRFFGLKINCNDVASFRVHSYKNIILSEVCVNLSSLQNIKASDVNVAQIFGHLDESTVRNLFTKAGKGVDFLNKFIKSVNEYANGDMKK